MRGARANPHARSKIQVFIQAPAGLVAGDSGAARSTRSESAIERSRLLCATPLVPRRRSNGPPDSIVRLLLQLYIVFYIFFLLDDLRKFIPD